MNKKSVHLLLLTLFALFNGLFSVTAHSQQADISGSVKLGALIPLTGGYAPYGELVLRGLELGLPDYVQTIVEDIGTMNAKDTVTASSKLVDLDDVMLAVIFGSDEAEWAAPKFNRAKTPLVIAWDSNPSVEALGEYVFSAGYEIASGAMLGAKYLLETLKVTSVAIVAEESSYNQAFVSLDCLKRRGVCGSSVRESCRQLARWRTSSKEGRVSGHSISRR